MQRFIIILLCVAAAAGAEAGYLPVAGPPALRFKFAFRGEVASLPPLITVEPVLAPVVTTNVVTVTNYVNTVAANAPVATNAVLAVPNLVNSATNKVAVVAFETKPEAEPLPPQVLMQFFRDRGSTNNPATVVGTVGFTPPPAVAPPSSKATFEKR